MEKTLNNTLDISKNILLYITIAFGIALFSQIAIPTPSGVPITLQTFIIALAGFYLSSKTSIKSIITYILIGLIGIPVFAQGAAGLISIVGLTGGFILGFILLTYLCSKAKNFNNYKIKISLGILGLLSCHFIGILQYSILSGLNLFESFIVASVPFLFKDVLSVILAFLISEKLPNKTI